MTDIDKREDVRDAFIESMPGECWFDVNGIPWQDGEDRGAIDLEDCWESFKKGVEFREGCFDAMYEALEHAVNRLRDLEEARAENHLDPRYFPEVEASIAAGDAAIQQAKEARGS